MTFFKEEKNRDPKNLKKCIGIDGRCMLCGTVFGLDPHHIISKGAGGDNSLWNLISLCRQCHHVAQEGYFISREIFVSARQIMIKLLRRLKSSDNFRWGKALDILEIKNA